LRLTPPTRFATITTDDLLSRGGSIGEVINLTLPRLQNASTETEEAWSNYYASTVT
jgi:hypothetical protein